MNGISPSGTLLPPLPEALKAAYLALVGRVDEVAADLVSRLHHTIHCGPGCSSCCRPFSVLPLEAALVRESAGPACHRPDTSDGCPLLANHRCTIYPARPLICRTQGLAIGYVDETNEQVAVSACPLNFSEEYPLGHDDLFYIDPFNSRLAALNLVYCREAGLDPHIRLPLG